MNIDNFFDENEFLKEFSGLKTIAKDVLNNNKATLYSESNKKIVINEATWEDLKELRRVIASVLLNQGIDLSALESENTLKKLQAQYSTNRTDFKDKIAKFVLQLETSKEFDTIFNKCLSYCTYDDTGMTPRSFDDFKELRGEYDSIRLAVLAVNFSRLLKKLIGMLIKLNILTPISENQE